MEILETRSDTALTLALKGRLDNATSSTFEERLLAYIGAGHTRLIIDLAQLDYISSVGLRVFIVGSKRLKPLGGRLVLCALQPEIRQVFEIAAFERICLIAATQEEAASLVL